MVTWLHFWIIAMMSMGFAVTDMVTNGYIGYKQKVAIIKGQSRVVFLNLYDPFFVYTWHQHLT